MITFTNKKIGVILSKWKTIGSKSNLSYVNQIFTKTSLSDNWIVNVWNKSAKRMGRYVHISTHGDYAYNFCFSVHFICPTHKNRSSKYWKSTKFLGHLLLTKCKQMQKFSPIRFNSSQVMMTFTNKKFGVILSKWATIGSKIKFVLR